MDQDFKNFNLCNFFMFIIFIINHYKKKFAKTIRINTLKTNMACGPQETMSLESKVPVFRSVAKQVGKQISTQSLWNKSRRTQKATLETLELSRKRACARLLDIWWSDMRMIPLGVPWVPWEALLEAQGSRNMVKWRTAGPGDAMVTNISSRWGGFLRTKLV